MQKLVQNADGSPLSEAQKQQAFVFDVTVSDGGTYTYSIDNGEPQLLTSGGTLTLRHGQTAVFESLPVGVTYSVTEQPVAGYAVSGTGHRGSITQAGSTARFTNLYAPGQTETGSLTVSKVKGEGADLQMEYAFTAVIGGQREAFILKHGESKTFPDLPVRDGVHRHRSGLLSGGICRHGAGIHRADYRQRDEYASLCQCV
ncbi:MAG: DUF5979 domain-containing protein [Clostridia bacterium]